MTPAVPEIRSVPVSAITILNPRVRNRRIFDELVARSIPEDKIVGISQGWKLGGAIKTTERRLAEGKLKHAEQPLMAWCVSNCRVEPRANSILITKQASGSAKIDPVMALFNAVSLMALNPAAAHKKHQIFILG